jgi:hypothetical protein
MRTIAILRDGQTVTVRSTTLYRLLAGLQDALGEDDDAVVAAALDALQAGRGAWCSPTVRDDVLALCEEEAAVTHSVSAPKAPWRPPALRPGGTKPEQSAYHDLQRSMP